jgi:hypothetical protein
VPIAWLYFRATKPAQAAPESKLVSASAT